MQKSETYISIIKNLSGEQTSEEQAAFIKWRQESEFNNDFYYKVKALWDQPDNKTFFGKFTAKKIKGFLFNQAIGNFIGFVIAFSVTRYFTHYEVERRSVKNLFGLAGRKKEIVHEMPEWLQWSLSIIVGYLVLEFVNHFIETKKHKIIYRYFKNNTNKTN